MDHVITSTFNETDNCWEIALSGEFDIFNSPELKASLNGFAEEKKANLRLDCANVTFMDSTALGSLVAVLKNVKTYEGKIVLCNLKPNLYKLFKITNLDAAFEIEGDTDGK